MIIALILVVLSVAEVASVVWVAHHIGIPATFGLLVAVSLVGAWMAKRVGLEVWRRFRATLAAGDVPSGEVFDGAVVLVAAALLLVPGFITDALGLLLLIPLVRSLVKWLFWRRMSRRLVAVTERFGRRRVSPIRVRAIRVGEGPAAADAASHERLAAPVEGAPRRDQAL